MAGNAEAQLLKKLKKKAEKVLVSKKEDKAKDSLQKENTKKIGETEKNLPNKDKQKKENKIMSMFGGGLEKVPDNYAFSYVLTYQMTTKKEQIPFQYYLEPEAPYFANMMQDSKTKSLVVYDLDENFMVTFMDDGKQKMAMKMVLPNMKKTQKKYGDKLFPDKGSDEVQIVPIESKKIQGYKCLGFKVTTKEGEGKVWITNDAPVSLNGVYSNFKTLPKTGPYANLPINKTSLIMEMEFQSSKKKSDYMHMLCTELKQESFEIKKKDYNPGQ